MALERRLSLGAQGEKAMNEARSAPGFNEESFVKKMRGAWVAQLKDQLASHRAATLRAQSAAGLAQIEAKARYSDATSRQIYLRAELARIQTRFQEEADEAIARAEALVALHGQLVDAVHILHENGKDIQRYLSMGFFERLFTDVKGMDPEKLKAMGEDLQALSEPLRSLSHGMITKE